MPSPGSVVRLKDGETAIILDIKGNGGHAAGETGRPFWIDVDEILEVIEEAE
jgi:hypothetical protein